MKNNRILYPTLFVMTLLFSCQAVPRESLNPEKYEQILTEFSRLRLEYIAYSTEEPPTAEYLLDSLAARHRIDRNQLIEMIAQEHPALYQAILRSR